MLEPTRKRHTKENVDSALGIPPEGDYITAEEWHKETFGDFPEWAIALAGYRYREDLTQKELAELIGTSQSDISKMERGMRPIGKNIARRLAKVFKTDYRVFF